MSRKTKEIKAELDKTLAKAKEMEVILQAAQDEEAKKLEDLKEQIAELCKNANMFCGVVLSADYISALVKLAIMNKEQIKIPFNLYYNE